MTVYRGAVQFADGSAPASVDIQIEEDRIRMWSGRKRIGSWALSDVSCRRVTPFRFVLEIDGEKITFTPEEPANFSDAVGAYADLRPRSRFGLADKLREATGA